MTLDDYLNLVGSVFFALGGGAVIVFTLSRWLGGVWAARILERERVASARESELLERRRNIYARLAVNLRIFLDSHSKSSDADKREFLSAYDEAALWASEEVAAGISRFIDLQVLHSKSPGAIPQEVLQEAYGACVVLMRKDVGYPQTTYSHGIVSF